MRVLDQALPAQAARQHRRPARRRSAPSADGRVVTAGAARPGSICRLQAIWRWHRHCASLRGPVRPRLVRHSLRPGWPGSPRLSLRSSPHPWPLGDTRAGTGPMMPAVAGVSWNCRLPGPGPPERSLGAGGLRRLMNGKGWPCQLKSGTPVTSTYGYLPCSDPWPRLFWVGGKREASQDRLPDFPQGPPGAGAEILPAGGAVAATDRSVGTGASDRNSRCQSPDRPSVQHRDCSRVQAMPGASDSASPFRSITGTQDRGLAPSQADDAGLRRVQRPDAHSDAGSRCGSLRPEARPAGRSGRACRPRALRPALKMHGKFSPS
jgi:hypothetical protein